MLYVNPSATEIFGLIHYPDMGGDEPDCFDVDVYLETGAP